MQLCRLHKYTNAKLMRQFKDNVRTYPTRLTTKIWINPKQECTNAQLKKTKQNKTKQKKAKKNKKTNKKKKSLVQQK